MQNPQNVKKTSSIIIAIFVVITMTFGGLIYVMVQKLHSIDEQYAQSILRQITHNIARLSYIRMTSSYEKMQTLAATITEDEAYNPIDVLQKIKPTIDANCIYYGIITAEHQAYVLDAHGQPVEIATLEIKKLLRNHKISHSYVQSFANHEHLNLVTVPILFKKSLYGTLFMLNQSFLPEKIHDVATFTNNINLYIMDDQSNIISASGNDFKIGTNVLERLEKLNPNDTETLLEIKQAISYRNGSIVTLPLEMQDYYLSFAPMPGGMWTVVATLPLKAIDSHVQYVLKIIIGTIGIWIIYFAVFTGYIIRAQHRSYLTVTNQASKLQQTLNEIPCGIVRCKNDHAWTIIDYTDALCHMIGADADDLKNIYNSSWLNLIHPEDRPRVKMQLQVKNHEVATSEYRILRKNNTPLHIMDNSRLVERQGDRWLWSVIINIEVLKKAQIKEMNMVERYKHLLEMSDNILYEYDLNTNQLYMSPQFFKTFNYPLTEHNGLEHYPVSNDIIHPEDMDLFTSMQMRIRVGGQTTSARLRIKTYHNQWLWCQLRQTAWSDDKGDLKAIGKLENVDKETRTLHKLRDDVQRDSFTMLYNKIATEDLVQRIVSTDEHSSGAFCIIDVDNFKKINSIFGHAMGDVVIKNLSTGLSHIFRSDDIIGRIGGDEFVVYVRDMPNIRTLLIKIHTIQDVFRQNFENGDIKTSISASIGIALFPKDGTSYSELYKNADKALYRSKITKDAYTFYDQEIDS